MRVPIRPSSQRRSNWPEPLLREFASQTLGAVRCSETYLEALRVILGSMSLADRIGVDLLIPVDVSFTSRSTMETIRRQMKSGGLVRERSWIDEAGYPHQSLIYRGCMVRDQEGSQYDQIQREQEKVDFTRFLYSLGVHENECPY